MRQLDLEGEFWIAEAQDARVPGRVKFDPASGARLELKGLLPKPPDQSRHTEAIPRVFGIAGHDQVTLVNCTRYGWPFEKAGVTIQWYICSHLFLGGHLDDPEHGFVAACLVLRNLNRWAGRTGTTIEKRAPESPLHASYLRMTHNPLPTESGPFEYGTLELGFTFRENLDLYGTTTLVHDAMLRVEFTNFTSLTSILSICTSLRNLLSIAGGFPSAIHSVVLTNLDCVVGCSGLEMPSVITSLYSGSVTDGLDDAWGQVNPDDMLFTLDDIGGVHGVGKWLTYSLKYRTVNHSLDVYLHAPPAVLESRFLNVVVAAESMALVHLNKVRIDLKRGLVELAKLACQPFQMVVGNVESWVSEIDRVRNCLAHRGLSEDIKSTRLRWLVESLHFLVVFCLLAECEVEMDVRTRIAGHGRVRAVAQRLQPPE